jgi:hypothetical protein
VSVPLHVSATFSVVGEAHDAETQTVPEAYFWQARAPSQAPLRLHCAADSSGHSSSGSVPALIGAHVPFATPVVASLHPSQTPSQGASQHTPSGEQIAPMHSPELAHVDPSESLHCPLLQTNGALQSALEKQVERHTPLAHVYPVPHAEVPPANAQTWPASHILAGCTLPTPTHTGGAQTVPTGYGSHPPTPSQLPSLEQSTPAAPRPSEQSSCGSLPALTGAHLPSCPPVAALEHAMHGLPVHAESQQNPSAQKPLAQSVGSEQVCPTAPLHAPEALQV